MFVVVVGVGGSVGAHRGSLVRGDGLQVHVEGGLAVVLLPPSRTSGGGVHSRVSGHRGMSLLTIL